MLTAPHRAITPEVPLPAAWSQVKFPPEAESTTSLPPWAHASESRKLRRRAQSAMQLPPPTTAAAKLSLPPSKIPPRQPAPLSFPRQSLPAESSRHACIRSAARDSSPDSAPPSRPVAAEN